jgi:hypothetical protein
VYDGEEFHSFWGDDWLDQLCGWLERQPPLLIYAHNGGRFDFLFMRSKLHGRCVIIDDRIVKARIGSHELRDSFACLPVALGDAGNKTAIDYDIFRAGIRERPGNRRRILDYLRDDCRNLWIAIRDYHSRFGRALTLGGAAWEKLISSKCPNGFSAAYYLQKLEVRDDAHFRQWAYGGRVEAFQTGIIRGNLTMFDKVSMYPYVACEYSHPGGSQWIKCDAAESDFAHVRAWSDGCLPSRADDGTLEYVSGIGEFRATGHELRAGIACGRVRIISDLGSVRFPVRAYLETFVREFFALKKEAERTGDRTAYIHAKLLLNAMTGKFATNPLGLHDYEITEYGKAPKDKKDGDGWEPSYIDHDTNTVIWRRQINKGKQSFYIKNVATFASITGAARACLFQSMHNADNVLYTDTDSILCSGFTGELGTDLHHWKIDAECTVAAIVDRKLYALFDERKECTKKDLRSGRFAVINGSKVPCVRMASAGVALNADQIYRLAKGETVHYRAEAPSMSLDGRQTYAERTLHGVSSGAVEFHRKSNRASRKPA